MNSTAQAYQKVKQLAKSDTTDYLGNVCKGTTTGALTGMAGGLMIGYYKKYNLFGSAVIGLLAGGLISNFFIKYKN